MIVDAHHHFFTKLQYEKMFQAYGSPEYLVPLLRDFSPQDLKPTLDRLDVRQTVLVQMENRLEHTHDLLKTALEHPWIKGVIGWVDLKDPKVGKSLEALQQHPRFFKGIRHPLELELDSEWALSREARQGLLELARRNFVFDLLVGPAHWEVIIRLADTLPNLSLVIEHFAKPAPGSAGFEVWVQAMKRFAQRPNITCKISGIMVLIPQQNWHTLEPAVLKPYMEKIIELFGSDRLMYGSDWPVSTLVGSYDQVLQAVQDSLPGLSEAEQSNLFCKTAERVYHLV